MGVYLVAPGGVNLEFVCRENKTEGMFLVIPVQLRINKSWLNYFVWGSQFSIICLRCHVCCNHTLLPVAKSTGPELFL